MEHSPEAAYALMRVAMQQFNKPLFELDDAERQTALQQTNRELAIAKKLLAAEEAAHVVIADTAVQQSLQELQDRFESVEEFEATLFQNGLDESRLRLALKQDLKVEAVIEQLVNEKGRVSDEEVEIYYYQHVERFKLPETRTARHLLITINTDYPENCPDAARRRLQTFRSRCINGQESFPMLAAKYSECPTAMHEGLLGRVKPGQLYPELEQALFTMEEEEVSDIVHSPLGLHLLFCQQVHPPETLSFEAVREKLHAHLEEKKRAGLLRDWLKQIA